MSSQTSGLELLLSFNHLHKFPFHSLASIFNPSSLIKPSIKPSKPSTKPSTKPSLISPAYTTTQLLVQNSQPISISISPSQDTHTTSASPRITLEARLQLLKVKLIDDSKRDPPAAVQQKPAWTESHAYVRGVRTNSSHLRLLATETNMIRANKITRSLRTRRFHLPKRKDEFVWGCSSPLRHSQVLQ